MDREKRIQRKLNKVDFLRQVCLNNADFATYARSFFTHLSKEIHNSTALEGNTIPLGDTEKLLKGMAIEEGSTIEKYEILDLANAYYSAYKYLKIPLSIQFITALHRELEQRTNINAGVLRSELRDNRGSKGYGAIYSDYSVVEAEMHQLCVAFNTALKFHPIERTVNMAMDFILTHPFTDGNGRLARLLLNWGFLKCGYIPVTIKVTDRDNYIEALNTSRVQHDYSYFLEYILDLMIKEYQILVNS